jgi:probable F420-dependent oxidoreductase
MPDVGPIGVWGHLDTLSAAAVADYARQVRDRGFGGLWVPETVGREPFTLLAMLAATTPGLVLGTSIASIWARDAQATRMAAMTLAEVTGGRFVLGLGVSHPHLAEKLRGHAFDRPLTRMREYLAAYRRAVYRGPEIQGAAEPPVLLAALRERMTDLAATDADGAFPYLVTAERVAWQRARLDAAAAVGRRPLLAVTLPVVLNGPGGSPDAAAAARAYLKPYLRTPTYQASWSLQSFEPADWEPPGSDRLLHAMVAIGDAASIHARIRELHAAGADHVAIIPLAADGTTEHGPTLDALAP